MDLRSSGPRGFGECRLWLVLALLLWLAHAINAGLVSRTSWDAAAEFADSSRLEKNPNGVWSYGWKPKGSNTFFLAKTHYKNPPYWSGWSSASGNPSLRSDFRVLAAAAGQPVTLPSRGLLLCPGIRGEQVVVRFTAPGEGVFRVSGQFGALEEHLPALATQVSVLQNNSKIGAFIGKIGRPAGARWASFTSRLFHLGKGDTLDFQVSHVTDRSERCQATRLVALIEKND